MHSKRFFAPILLTLAAALSVSLVPCASAASVDAQQVALGRKLYDTHCVACHRVDGRGGVHFPHAVSADLRAPGLERTYHGDDALMIRAILQAKDEDGKRLDAPMPRWAGRISQHQAQAIVAYLHTLESQGSQHDKR